MLAVLVGQRTLRLPVTGFERGCRVQAPATAYVKLSWLHHCRAQRGLPGRYRPGHSAPLGTAGIPGLWGE